MESFLFGDKNQFAIELGNFTSHNNRGKLCFWLHEVQFGDFKKNHTLKFAIKAIKELLSKCDKIYENTFDSKAIEENFISFLGKGTDGLDENDFKLYEPIKRFSYFFGDQLDGTTHIIYFEVDIIHFIWSTNSDYSGRPINYLKNLKKDKISVESFKKVSLSFLNSVSE